MNILYGVPGEGMGHATRAKVILKHLEKNHNLRILSSERAFIFLKNNFPDKVHEIKGFHLGFKDGAVSKSQTALITIKNAPDNLKKNFQKFNELHKTFIPDLVISDFESFAYFYAKFHKIPIISIDNMQIIDRGKLDIDIPPEEKANYLLAKNIVKSKVPNCNKYIISSFFNLTLIKKDSIIVPPIVRDEIIKAATSVNNHILVYQSSYGKNGILKLLKILSNEKILLYGFNKEEDHGNVQMKKFSEDEFIANFASSKAVIANGGYSFISEAIYLKKPICSVPIKNQFEQYLNGAYVEKCGYGKLLNDFNLDGIKSFLYDLPVFRNNIEKYSQDGNSELFSTLDKAIAEFEKP